MNNIFLLRYIPANEDFFTAAFEYLLNEVPELGQEIVDYICQNSVQKSVKFKKAIDHPSLGDSKSKPDLLLQCEGSNIICEHKLVDCGLNTAAIQNCRRLIVNSSLPLNGGRIYAAEY